MDDPTESTAALAWSLQLFLNREAEWLDDRDLQTWLDHLADDLIYRVPRRMTRRRGDVRSEFSEEAFHLRETRETLERRIERFDEEYAWAENPPSRTRRIVGNVRVDGRDEHGIATKSNFHLFYSQGDTADSELLAGERHDVIRETDDGFRLAERTVYLDSTVLPLPRLSIFL